MSSRRFYRSIRMCSMSLIWGVGMCGIIGWRRPCWGGGWRRRIVWEQKVSTLSGGQRSRLALAKILIAEPDLLLLDEPTNHLDLIAIEWLEKYLADYKGSVVIISHDRFLLDRLATRIVWLTQQKINSYKGN